MNEVYNVTFRRDDDCVPAAISALTGIDAFLLPLPETAYGRNTDRIWRRWARQYNSLLQSWGVPVRIRFKRLGGRTPNGKWIGLAYVHQVGALRLHHAMLMEGDRVLWNPTEGGISTYEDVWAELRVNDRRRR